MINAALDLGFDCAINACAAQRAIFHVQRELESMAADKSRRLSCAIEAPSTAPYTGRDLANSGRKSAPRWMQSYGGMR